MYLFIPYSDQKKLDGEVLTWKASNKEVIAYLFFNKTMNPPSNASCLLSLVAS